MIETHVKPGTLELQARLLDDCVELTEQVEKQSERLVDLKAKRDANPGMSLAFYAVLRLTWRHRSILRIGRFELCVRECRYAARRSFRRWNCIYSIHRRCHDDGRYRQIIVRSSLRAKSQPILMVVRVCRQTSKSKRRAGLKKLSGKKGTIYEESYLLNSMKKAVEVRLLEIESASPFLSLRSTLTDELRMIAEVSALLPILLSLNSTPQRNAAQALQATLNELLAFLDKELSTNWDWREAEWLAETRDEQDQRERGVWLEKGPVEEGTERVLRPAWPKKKWRVAILDSL